LQSFALETGAAQLERRARIGCGHDAAKPSLRQGAQRDPLTLGKLARLTKKRIRNSMVIFMTVQAGYEK
jgi:hypothetical protein